MSSDDRIEPLNGSDEVGDLAASAGITGGRQLSWPSVFDDGDEEATANETLERVRLESQISAAKARAAAARLAAADRAAAIRAALRDDLADSQQQLADMERESEEQAAQIKREAEAEVERILGEARARAAEIAGLLEGNGDGDE